MLRSIFETYSFSWLYLKAFMDNIISILMIKKLLYFSNIYKDIKTEAFLSFSV